MNQWLFGLRERKLNYSLYPTLYAVAMQCSICVQRFSEVTDQLGMAILSVTPEKPLFPNPVLPKTSVYNSFRIFVGG